MEDRSMAEALGNIWLAILRAIFFCEGYRAISIVTEDGGKCFVFVDLPANIKAFEKALKTAAGEVFSAISAEPTKYN